MADKDMIRMAEAINKEAKSKKEWHQNWDEKVAAGIPPPMLGTMRQRRDPSMYVTSYKSFHEDSVSDVAKASAALGKGKIHDPLASSSLSGTARLEAVPGAPSGYIVPKRIAARENPGISAADMDATFERETLNETMQDPRLLACVMSKTIGFYNPAYAKTPQTGVLKEDFPEKYVEMDQTHNRKKDPLKSYFEAFSQSAIIMRGGKSEAAAGAKK